MALSAGLLAVLGRGTRARFLLSVGSHGGARRYAFGDYASASGGHYAGKLVSLGSWGSALSDRAYGMERWSCTAKVTDTDGDLSTLAAEGDDTVMAPGVVAAIYLADPALASGDWYTARSGVIEAFSMDAQHEWSFTLAPNDLPLRRNVPSDEWLIGTWDWPNASPKVMGGYAPVVYGTHDSSPVGGGGAVTLRIDTAALRYLVGAGCLKAVDRVYVDGSVVTNWSSSYVTINGRSYTVVTFTTDPEVDGEVVVTADVRGLTSTGDGAGTLLSDPTDQLANFLHNFTPWGGWRTGDWYTSTAPLDAATFTTAKAWLASLGFGGIPGRMKVAGGTSGYDVLNKWCATFGVYGYWTDAGNIALAFEDHRANAYPTSPILPGQALGSYTASYETQGLLDRAAAADASGPLSLVVRDTTAKAGLGGGGVDIDAEWIAA